MLCQRVRLVASWRGAWLRLSPQPPLSPLQLSWQVSTAISHNAPANKFLLAQRHSKIVQQGDTTLGKKGGDFQLFQG